MLNRKAIALHVENLTDARYFAALGVSHLAFTYLQHVDYPSNVKRLKEIMAWCEGIDYLIEYDPANHDLIHSIYKELSFVGMVCTDQDMSKVEGQRFIRIEKYEDATEIANEKVILISDKETSQTLLDNNECYFTLAEENLSLLQENPDLGIAVTGGSEEKVGYKSYEELDGLLEKLEE